MGAVAGQERDPRGVDALPDRPPFADLFAVKGRRWLGELELPVEERETVDAGMRQIEFLDTEIAAVAASFVAAVGDNRPLPQSAQAGRLFGAGPTRAPVGQRPRQPRPDLQAGLGARPPRVGGVVLERGPPARSAARVLSARACPSRALGRHRRLRAQAGVPVLGPAHDMGATRPMRAAPSPPPPEHPRSHCGASGISASSLRLLHATRSTGLARPRPLALCLAGCCAKPGGLVAAGWRK